MTFIFRGPNRDPFEQYLGAFYGLESNQNKLAPRALILKFGHGFYFLVIS